MVANRLFQNIIRKLYLSPNLPSQQRSGSAATFSVPYRLAKGFYLQQFKIEGFGLEEGKRFESFNVNIHMRNGLSQ